MITLLVFLIGIFGKALILGVVIAVALIPAFLNPIFAAWFLMGRLWHAWVPFAAIMVLWGLSIDFAMEAAQFSLSVLDANLSASGLEAELPDRRQEFLDNWKDMDIIYWVLGLNFGSILLLMAAMKLGDSLNLNRAGGLIAAMIVLGAFLVEQRLDSIEAELHAEQSVMRMDQAPPHALPTLRNRT